MKEFKNLIDNMTVEFEEHNRRYKCGITCEFSTSSDDFEDKVDYLMKKNVRHGRWSIFRCETCCGYNEETPWHVQIEDFLDWDELHEEKGKIEREHFEMELHTKEVLKQMKNKEFYPKGTLKEFVDLFECLVENPQQYSEYINASLIADNAYGTTQWIPESKWYKEHVAVLEDMCKIDESDVKWYSTVDTFIEKDGTSRWNMFSDINGGCCAYAHLTEFDYLAGKRVRVKIGVIDKSS